MSRRTSSKNGSANSNGLKRQMNCPRTNMPRLIRNVERIAGHLQIVSVGQELTEVPEPEGRLQSDEYDERRRSPHQVPRCGWIDRRRRGRASGPRAAQPCRAERACSLRAAGTATT